MVEYFVMCTVIPLVGFNLLQNKNYLLTYLLVGANPMIENVEKG